MPAPIALFAFNRPEHLRRALAALAANAPAMESDLIIYCDGPRNDADLPQVHAVLRTAEAAAGFKSVTVRKRERNYGVDPNIFDGVTAVVNDYGRVIVIEDDLVVSPYFLQYINDGLDIYADNAKVACILGWCFPHSIKEPPETFFLRGAENLGWGTWKRAWDIFEPDAAVLLAELTDRKLQKAFDLDGAYPYTAMLEKVATGSEEYWDVRWLASAFLRDMYTLYPGHSLVRHAGFDGSGTHCGKTPAWEDRLADSPVRVMPIAAADNIRMRDEYKKFSRRVAETSFLRGTIKKIASQLDIKYQCKDLLPPVLLRYIQKLRRQGDAPSTVRWEGNYTDWQSAAAAASGYDHDAIFIKVREAARAVRGGRALWERDSVLFYHEEYHWPLLSGLMAVAAWNRGRLSVLDFGGALGSTYMQHRSLLNGLDELRWNIVEQPHFVACGREEFTTDILRFWPSMGECAAVSPPDVILFSSVLQYLEESYAVLEQAASFRPKVIILDRTPFAPKGERITVQHTPPEIYPASYPCRWLDRRRVNEILESRYRLLPDHNTPIDPPGFCGFMAVRKD